MSITVCVCVHLPCVILILGTVFRFYSRHVFENDMRAYDTPEMLRVSLASTVLKLKVAAHPTRHHARDGVQMEDVKVESVLSDVEGVLSDSLGQETIVMCAILYCAIGYVLVTLHPSMYCQCSKYIDIDASPCVVIICCFLSHQSLLVLPPSMQPFNNLSLQVHYILHPISHKIKPYDNPV